MATTDRPPSGLRGTVGAVLCLVLTAGIFVAGAAAIRDREATVGSDFTLEVPDADMVPDILPDAGPEEDIPTDADTDADREEAPPETTPGDGVIDGDASADPEPTTRLDRPIVLAAGRLTFSGSIVELADVEPVEIERKCKSESGEPWPCGRMARTAFANYVRGRTVDCTVPATSWDGTVTARCSLAGTDLSQWLVEHGWAEVSVGSDLEKAAGEAREAGRGLYGPDLRQRRPGALPDATAGQSPGDGTGPLPE